MWAWSLPHGILCACAIFISLCGCGIALALGLYVHVHIHFLHVLPNGILLPLHWHCVHVSISCWSLSHSILLQDLPLHWNSVAYLCGLLCMYIYIFPACRCGLSLMAFCFKTSPCTGIMSHVCSMLQRHSISCQLLIMASLRYVVGESLIHFNLCTLEHGLW